MPRNRMIKPAFFEDPKLGREDDPLMLLIFIGTWVLADDEGNLTDDSAFLRSYILPYTRRFSPEDVGRRIERLCEIGCLVRYEACGERYLHIVQFKKHQVLRKPTQRHPKPTEEHIRAALVAHRDGSRAGRGRHYGGTSSSVVVAKGKERKGKEERSRNCPEPQEAVSGSSSCCRERTDGGVGQVEAPTLAMALVAAGWKGTDAPLAEAMGALGQLIERAGSPEDFITGHPWLAAGIDDPAAFCQLMRSSFPGVDLLGAFAASARKQLSLRSGKNMGSRRAGGASEWLERGVKFAAEDDAARVHREQEADPWSELGMTEEEYRRNGPPTGGDDAR